MNGSIFHSSSVRALWHYLIQYNTDVCRRFSPSSFVSDLKVSQRLEAWLWGQNCTRAGGAKEKKKKRQEAWGEEVAAEPLHQL